MGRRKADPRLQVEIRRLVAEPVWRVMDDVIEYFHFPCMEGKGAAHFHVLTMIDSNWFYAMFWFAEKMSGALSEVDINRQPYIQKDVIALKPMGYEFWAYFHLIQGCYEESKQYRRHYQKTAPIKIWGLIMKEFKCNEAEALVKGTPNNPATVGKTKMIRFLDELYSWKPSIKDVPKCLEHIEGPHTERLLRTALELSASNHSFHEKYFAPWIGFLKSTIAPIPGQNAYRYGAVGEGDSAKVVRFKGNSRMPVPFKNEPITNKPSITQRIPQSDGSTLILQKPIGSPFSKEKVWKKQE